MYNRINTKYKKELGNKGENKAGTFYESIGFDILSKNFRFSTIGEIDLIAKKENLIVFAEVKSRSGSAFGGARYSITNRKKNTLKKVARHFLRTHPEFFSKTYQYRFDLVSVEKEKIELIEDIIR
ncbi:MAG: YraN family protein [Spirochaetes bacterium]|nr:YraN family protein [Spirochaetota bacterium]